MLSFCFYIFQFWISFWNKFLFFISLKHTKTLWIIKNQHIFLNLCITFQNANRNATLPHAPIQIWPSNQSDPNELPFDQNPASSQIMIGLHWGFAYIVSLFGNNTKPKWIMPNHNPSSILAPNRSSCTHFGSKLERNSQVHNISKCLSVWQALDSLYDLQYYQHRHPHHQSISSGRPFRVYPCQPSSGQSAGWLIAYPSGWDYNLLLMLFTPPPIVVPAGNGEMFGDEIENLKGLGGGNVIQYGSYCGKRYVKPKKNHTDLSWKNTLHYEYDITHTHIYIYRFYFLTTRASS